MTPRKTPRVMWLLNHTTLRRFEIERIRSLGIVEIFSPKRFPYDEGNLSASVDYSLDEALSISREDLAVLNDQDWYDSPSEQAWRIANREFDIAIIGFFPRQIASVVKNFRGSIVLRVFGLAKGYSYSRLLTEQLGPGFIQRLGGLGERFWFGAGYAHLMDEEGILLKKRNCFLPVGLSGKYEPDRWTGADKRVFFVCPRIETSPYFRNIYDKFKRDFHDFDFVVGGAQPLPVGDPEVLGFVPRDVHDRNMRDFRVMFYHSSEPNHVHYHPFEAVQSGMPLVFMAGGMLDLLGGKDLPGRCVTIKEARLKIRRILNDDKKLIEKIRKTQAVLLDAVSSARCAKSWDEGFKRIVSSLGKENVNPLVSEKKAVRIAVIVPIGYRGDSLRGAKLVARAIETGSRQANQAAEVVFAHLDDPAGYPEEEFSDLPPSIKRRPYRWRILARDEASRAMIYAGMDCPLPSDNYLVPDDGMNQFLDCDLWVIVSDRLSDPLLPVRPYVMMVYDYLQRYVSFLPQHLNEKYISAAHASERVFVTTEFTRQDAIQYAGLPARKVCKLPMLSPAFDMNPVVNDNCNARPYFLWTTNLALHKNHSNALRALRLYYEEYDGQLDCKITGVDSKMMFKSELPHLKPLTQLRCQSPALKRHLKVLGELPDRTYQSVLAGAQFLWHAARIDNGTFSVIEAASLRVPSLSSDYPAMREIDAQFRLNLEWMDPDNPVDMAKKLKSMEADLHKRRGLLPSFEQLQDQSLEKLAGACWEGVSKCL